MDVYIFILHIFEPQRSPLLPPSPLPPAPAIPLPDLQLSIVNAYVPAHDITTTGTRKSPGCWWRLALAYPLLTRTAALH